MAVNEKHPDFPEYKRKWDELMERLDEERSKCAPLPEFHGRDNGPIDSIYRKYSKKISALQKEYKHLYE